MIEPLARKTRLPEPVAGECHPVTAAQCRRDMFSVAFGVVAGLLIMAFGLQATLLVFDRWPLLPIGFFITSLFLTVYLLRQGMLQSMQRGAQFEMVYTALDSAKQATAACVVVILLIFLGALTIRTFLPHGIEPATLAATALIVGVLSWAAIVVVQRTARKGQKLKMDFRCVVPESLATVPVSGDASFCEPQRKEGAALSVSVCEGGEKAQSEVRRPLQTDECTKKITQAIGLAILGLFGAILIPGIAGRFFFCCLILRQIFAASHWSGLQRHLRRGKTVELIATHTAPRGYVPSFSVVMSVALCALVCTIATVLVPVLDHLGFDRMVNFALATAGIWWVARYLWRRVLPAPVIRAIITPNSALLTLD